MNQFKSPRLINYLQIGKGRLGQRIMQAILADPALSSLAANNRILTARIDQQQGLDIINRESSAMHIKRLLICIAPGAAKQWRWETIFDGLINQVKQNKLTIDELIFIGSTRVYDGINRGVVDASTEPQASSERAQSLLLAEQKLMSIANSHCILRCCGLVGDDYQRYQLIIEQADEKARFAVNLELVVEKVTARLSSSHATNQQSIVTDGYCYYAGKRLNMEQSLGLANEHRILKQSDAFQFI